MTTRTPYVQPSESPKPSAREKSGRMTFICLDHGEPSRANHTSRKSRAFIYGIVGLIRQRRFRHRAGTCSLSGHRSVRSIHRSSTPQLYIEINQRGTDAIARNDYNKIRLVAPDWHMEINSAKPMPPNPPRLASLHPRRSCWCQSN